MHKKMFSVVIPTHNRPGLLRRALSSLARQTFKDFEVILVNDGSSASYESVLQDYSQLISQYFVNVNPCGVSAARNRGIFSSAGMWILFLDDDDELDDGYLAYLSYYIKANNISFSFLWSSIKTFTYEEGDAAVKESVLAYEERPHDKQYIVDKALTIGASYGLVVSKDAFYITGVFDSSLPVGEDTDFILKMLECGVSPHPLAAIGVIKHNHAGDRLSMSYSKYSDYRIYEKIFSRHHEYLLTIPEIYKQLLSWAASVHFKNNNFTYGDQALKRVLSLKPLTIKSVEWFAGGKLTKLGIKFPKLNGGIIAFFALYKKLRT